MYNWTGPKKSYEQYFTSKNVLSYWTACCKLGCRQTKYDNNEEEMYTVKVVGTQTLDFDATFHLDFSVQ